MSKPLTGETTCRRGMDLWSYIFAIKILLLERPLAEGKGGCRNVWCGEANKTPKTKTKTDTKRKFTQNNKHKTNLAFCCVWLCLVALWKRVFFARYTAPFEVLYWKRPLAEGMVMCVSVYAWKKTSFPQQNRAKQTTNWDDKAILTEDLQIWDLAPFSVGPLGKKFISSPSEEEKGSVHLQSHFNTNQNGKGKKNCSIG
jgi:hypothetical protein